jgi:DNA-directed RNA polymerase III subunit RPC6
MPAKEITGGPWYTDQEFDHEFVAALSSFILQFIQSQKMVDAPTINIRVKKSGISTVELTLDELELVLQTLIYDGKIEEVRIYIAIIQVTYSSIPLYIDRYRVLF